MLTGGATPKRSRMLGVSSAAAAAGAAAKGLEAEVEDLNFSMAAASSSISCLAVLSSMLPPPFEAAVPKALKDRLMTDWMEVSY